ncbi:MAG: acetyl-CoA carboxylase carboxyl transferase subunit beta, partial [Burkholderiaceae bacterium]
MSWIDKLLPPRIQTGEARRRSVPEGVWLKCPSCDAVLYRNDLEKNLQVCPACSHHLRIRARLRLDQLLDADGRIEIGQTVEPIDSLKFKDSRKYPERLSEAQNETNETDAMVVMSGA